MPVTSPIAAAALPTPPSTNNPASFDTQADNFLGALPQFKTDMQALADNVYQNSLLTESSANAGLASSNFKGTWASLAGALNKPASVYHNGAYWQLLNNLANVAASQPGVTADWVVIAIIGFPTNRVINGAMEVDQRNAGAAKTFTAGAALAYCVDRWYGYCTGANVNGQQVAGSAQARKRYQFTGAAGVTGIGFGQRIEMVNSYDLNGRTCTLAVDLANSLLTTVTWTAYYANTADTFGTLASPTRTQIATGTFTVTNAVARYYAQIAVPAAATTGVEIVFSVAAQVSGTWTIGDVQLFPGGVRDVYIDKRPFAAELALCQRYYRDQNVLVSAGLDAWISFFGGSNAVKDFPHPVPMRAAPAATFTNNTPDYYSYGAVWTATAATVQQSRTDGITLNMASDGDGRSKLLRGASGGTVMPVVSLSAEL